MEVNWDAISAIVAAIALVAGLWASWRGGIRSTITYAQHFVNGKIDGIGKQFEWYDNSITAKTTIFKNRGKNVSNFSVRFRGGKFISFEVSQTTSIDENSVKFSKNDDGHLTVIIDDFPAGEKITIDCIATGNLSRFDRPIGGSSTYKFVERDEFIGKRVVTITATLFFAFLIYRFGPDVVQRFI